MADRRPFSACRKPHPAPLCATLLAALLAAGTAALYARGEDGTEPLFRVTEEAQVAWVLVPVVVRDDAGFVGGLAAADFRLRVDGAAVPIASFEADAAAPVSLIYLQDLSGSMANGGKLEASRAAFRCLLARARPGDEVALATFASGRTRVEVPFTQELAVFEEALAAWEGFGTTALHDAVAWLPEIQLDGRGLKGAVVLATDGVDNASALSPDKARELLRRAALPVYVLALRRQGVPAAGAAAGADEERFGTVLARLAEATGGRYDAVASAREVQTACTAVAGELHHQYVLSFPTTSRGPAEHRRIEVEVVDEKSRGLRVTHRQGYRGRPPQTP